MLGPGCAYLTGPYLRNERTNCSSEAKQRTLCIIAAEEHSTSSCHREKDENYSTVDCMQLSKGDVDSH
ncbi:hypothetical protein Tco_1002196 [Tanacetum coccineum]|uniref:Uncharacterized protein n=1 Tax=Tanacetum coccineum TaxID=301880 RepID=A0ABQ5F5N2_9ASTR